MALAQLAAYVFQLVGRCFLGLPDLDPEAFQVGGCCLFCTSVFGAGWPKGTLSWRLVHFSTNPWPSSRTVVAVTVRGSAARMDTCHVAALTLLAPLTFFAVCTPSMSHGPWPQDLAGGDDLEAELLPDGDVQLSTQGLADLLGVPSSLLTTGGSRSSSNGGTLTAGSGGSGSSSANGPSREAAATGSGGSGGSSSALSLLARQGSGAASSDLALPLAGGGGDAAAAGAQLLQRGTQCIAAYAASGGAEGASAAAHERPSLVLRRQKRQEGPGPAELLAALQQQTALVSRAAECVGLKVVAPWD